MTFKDVAAVGCREGWLPISPEAGLYYRDYGTDRTSPPLVCLHGYWRTSRDFEELAAHFAPTRRVLLLDMRGRGRSSRFPDAADYHLDRMVEDVVRLLDAEHVDKAVLIGLALGASIAMELAAKRPERVEALILNDSGPEANMAAGHRMASFAGHDHIDAAEALRRVKAQYAESFPRMDEEGFRRLVYRNYAVTADGNHVRDFDPLTNEELKRIIAVRPTMWDVYRAIVDIPVTVLRGENSESLTREIAQRMCEAKPDTRVVEIPDTGHPVMLWEPEAFRAIEEAIAPPAS